MSERMVEMNSKTVNEMVTEMMDELSNNLNKKDVPKIMGVTEVAKEYGIARQSVLQMVNKGELDAEKIGNIWCIYMTSHTLSRLARVDFNKELYTERMNKHRAKVLDELNADDKHTRVCPLCGRVYTDEPALSRKDNKTAICPQCGLQEALDAFANRHREVS